MNMKRIRQSEKPKTPPKWKKFVDELACFAERVPIREKLFSHKKIDPQIISTLQVLFPLMTCSHESFEESLYEGQYGKWFYKTILKKKPKLYDKLELEPPEDVSSLTKLYTISPPRGIQSLVRFYEKLN
jgi:hypothetical protein